MNWRQVVGVESAGEQSGVLGLIMLIVSCGALAIFGASDGHEEEPWLLVTVILVGLLVFGLSVRHLRACCRRLPATGQEAYLAYNLGLSIACAAFSFIAVVVLTILIARGELGIWRTSTDLNPKEVGRVLWVSGMVAALGATFYCLRKMGTRFGEAPPRAPEEPEETRERAQGGAEQDEEDTPDEPAAQEDDPVAPPEEFTVSRFWSGLWYRIAQAEVYTIVLFLLIWGGFSGATQGDSGPGILGLPVLALFMGLFVRPAEELIAGMAERLFAVARALLPRMSTGSGSGG